MCWLNGWQNVEELLQFRAEVRAESPSTQVLFILDDEGQASYTSGHATNLWLEDLPVGEYSSRTIDWLRGELSNATLEFEGQLTAVQASDIDLVAHLDNSDRLFRGPLRCQMVESDDPSMAIAGEPNGYFMDDLTPAQNYLLAERLRAGFGLKIFGLGATFASYCRTEPLDATEARAVVDSVKGLYADMNDDVADQWAGATAGRNWFGLSYRGA